MENPNAPKQSTQGFISPIGATVKKSPSVKDLINDPVIVTEERKEEKEEKEVKVSEEVVEEKEKSGEEEGEKEEEKIIEGEQLTFEEHWIKVADLFFDKMPTVYYSIKENIPEIKNNIVYIGIKNPLQEDLIASKKREVLSYLRTYFDNAIEEVEIVVDEQMETKVKLLTSRDKVEELVKQNEELTDFLKILNLSVKE